MNRDYDAIAEVRRHHQVPAPNTIIDHLVLENILK
jgi:hypothetical protein